MAASQSEPLSGSTTSPATTSGAPTRTNGKRRAAGGPGSRSENAPASSGTTSAKAPSPPISAPTWDGESVSSISTTGP